MSITKSINIFAGFGTACLLTFTVITPALAQFQMNQNVRMNCVNADFLKGKDLSILSDPDSGTVVVNYLDDNNLPVEFLLNYKGNDGFAGCSQEARRILGNVKMYNEKIKNDMCVDMAEISKGNRPMPVREGLKPSLNDAKTYVQKECQNAS